MDGALAAVDRLRADGAVVDVRHEVPPGPDPRWQGVYLHGIQFEEWARAHADALPVVLGDRPPQLVGLEQAGVVDWCWDQGAYVAGALAAVLADGAACGLVAGPPVLTQRRVASAYAAGVVSCAEVPVEIRHLVAFDDLAGGRVAGDLLGKAVGVGVLAHAADAAGDLACAVARGHGVPTIGFLGNLGAHAANLASDTAGVVEHVLRRLIADDQVRGVIDCGLGSPFLNVELAAAHAERLTPVRDRAIADVVAGTAF